jgi:hypothetical protein
MDKPDKPSVSVSGGGRNKICINLQDGLVIFNMSSDLAVKAADEINAQLDGIAKSGKGSGPRNAYLEVRGFSFRLPSPVARELVKAIREYVKSCRRPHHRGDGFTARRHRGATRPPANR